MAIMKAKPSAAPLTMPSPVIIEPKNSHSVLVDNKEIPRESLITHVAGIAFVVDYYRLVINKDNALYSQDVGQSGTQQQYIKYKNFELRQQGSLTVDQDDTDKVFAVRGTSIVHSGLVPNEGDMFSGDVGDGRLGVFNVTRSQRLTTLKGSTYQIEYALAYFTTSKPNDYVDLESKVIETYFYVKERLDFNESPFLTTQEYDFVRRLGNYYKEMCQNYFHWFFSKEFAVYLVPSQLASTFDYFLYNALRSIFKDDHYSVLQKHQAINIEDDDLIDRKLDLFSVLLERSSNKFEICDRRVGVVRTSGFNHEGSTTNIRFTGIRNLIYPISLEARADEGYNRLMHSPIEGTLTPSLDQGVLYPKEVKEFLFGDKTVPLIKLVSVDDYYIFSQDFYERTSNLSILEEQVLNYIDGKSCNTVALKLLCDNYKYWPKLERFYYMPIILILIQSVLKDV